MHVLLTGGSGFLGLNIAEALLARGNAVTLFSNAALPAEAARAFAALPGRMREIVGDIRDPEVVTRAAAGATAVIHAAAITPGAAREVALAAQAVAVNITGTLNALAAARASGGRRLVFLGSASVYGSVGPDIAELDETRLPEPVAVYPVTKFAAERLLTRLGTDIDLRLLRIGSAFGPWERDTGVRDTLSAILQVTAAARCDDEVVLPRLGRRDWIYSRDLADAVVHLLDHTDPPRGPINIGLGAQWTVADWCADLANVSPGFRWRIDATAPTIDFHGPDERPPLAIRRLRASGFTPRYDRTAAFADYMHWLDTREHVKKEAP